MGGNLRFKIDWASLWWEGNLPFLLCFSLYSKGNSKYKSPGGGGGGAYIRRGDLTEGFFALRFWGGLIFGGAYTWRGLLSEFYGNLKYHCSNPIIL